MPLSLRPAPRLLRASDIEPKETHWLWYPYIPYGAGTLIYGAGGLGKSTIAAQIAAAVTTGAPLPGQSPAPRRPHKVLFLSAEDDPERILQPRFARAGADLRNIYIPEASFVLDANGISNIRSYIADVAATIVIIDPIVSYIGSKVDINRSNEVRAIIDATLQAARNSEGAVIFIGHARKGDEGKDFEKIMGSLDFINAMRSVLFVKEGNDGKTLLTQPKANWGPKGKPIGFEISPDGSFQWTGEVEDSSGRTILRTRAQAKTFLREVLREGPVRATEVEEFAGQEGISKTTLTRAKVGVAESFLEVRDGVKTWWWRLV